MKVGIIGTRGIPNYYGGFEQFAQYLAKLLVEKGHEVTVYNSHYHPYKGNEWEGVRIIHKFDPEQRIGTIGQFFYDLNCILDSRIRNFDILLQLGYTSSSIWGRLFPKKHCKVITNMDGLEWKRTKYSKPVQRFLLWAEWLGIKYSDVLVADSIGIKDYLFKKYHVDSFYIPYGAEPVSTFSTSVLKEYSLNSFGYSMLLARLEPENSIEIILDGLHKSDTKEEFLVIGNNTTAYGTYLKAKFKDDSRIRFLGGIYNMNKLNSLRHFAKLYFHGHTVGGTNPSLLEAMGSKALICAHDNIFNRSILGNEAWYFSSSRDVSELLNKESYPQRDRYIDLNCQKIKELYGWERIVSQYETVFYNAIR
ncbi:DUF1972 domain-containing protein [Geofilum sp. OHC36d9]|uniref:DUF1972 domain-containing protein n=1 Tax=Geofilum sp. OHC36d9 TaxID=3458413 RepID=UPI004034AAD3